MDNGLVQTGFLQSMPSVEVLILVVVDNGLVPTMANVTINGLDGVLILVVVDNGLVHQILNFYKVESIRLNPCCSGQWSRTH